MTTGAARIFARRESFVARAQAQEKTEAWQAVLKRWNPRWLTWQGVADFIESELKIITPERELVPFRLRRVQRQIIAAEIHARRQKRRPEFIILKFRKVGATSVEEALAYWEISRRQNGLCAMYGHTPVDTKIMFQAIDEFWNHQTPEFRHERTEASVEHIEFPGINGYMLARTAGKGGAGRGGSYSRIHVAEASRVPNLAELYGALSKARGPSGALVLESTAAGREGIGKPFYEMWKGAVAGKNNLIPIFLPWQSDPTNKIALLAPDEIDDILRDDQEARELMEQNKLSKEQMKYWLAERKSLVVDGRSSQLIHQEMPTTAEGAFIISGNSYYDLDMLRRRENECVNPIKVEDNGRLKIWEEPDRDKPACYVMGIDPSGGRGGADSAIVGFNAKTGKQAFEWVHDRTAPSVLGFEVIPRLGRRWAHPRTGQRAFVVCENNNHGHAVLGALLREALYPRDCVYHTIDEAAVDDQNQPEEQETRTIAGWTNNPKSHADLTSVVGKMVADKGYPKIYSKDVIQSIRSVTLHGSDGADFKDRDRAVAAGLGALGIPHTIEGTSSAYIGGRVVEF